MNRVRPALALALLLLPNARMQEGVSAQDILNPAPPAKAGHLFREHCEEILQECGLAIQGALQEYHCIVFEERSQYAEGIDGMDALSIIESLDFDRDKLRPQLLDKLRASFLQSRWTSTSISTSTQESRIDKRGRVILSRKWENGVPGKIDATNDIATVTTLMAPNSSMLYSSVSNVITIYQPETPLWANALEYILQPITRIPSTDTSSALGLPMSGWTMAFDATDSQYSGSRFREILTTRKGNQTQLLAFDRHAPRLPAMYLNKDAASGRSSVLVLEWEEREQHGWFPSRITGARFSGRNVELSTYTFREWRHSLVGPDKLRFRISPDCKVVDTRLELVKQYAAAADKTGLLERYTYTREQEHSGSRSDQN